MFFYHSKRPLPASGTVTVFLPFRKIQRKNVMDCVQSCKEEGGIGSDKLDVEIGAKKDNVLEYNCISQTRFEKFNHL